MSTTPGPGKGALIRSVGVCLGASGIQVAELLQDAAGIRVGRTAVRGHASDPRAMFREVLREFDLTGADCGLLTGRKFRTMVNARSITEPEAVEGALAWLRRQGDTRTYSAVASLGAENFVVYVLDRHGHVVTVETGNKCASGTGEFFLQQIGRMGIGPEEAARLGCEAEPYRVSGRCSVFCKSDCTHALNKGVPIGRVTAGLCRMMAEKVLELLEKSGHRDVLAVGGVTRNAVIMQLLRERIEGFTTSPHAEVFEALGAAYRALTQGVRLELDGAQPFHERRAMFDRLPPIADGERLVRFAPGTRAAARGGEECIVGLDVGSTTTKAVVLRTEDDAVLAAVYLRTNGNPIRASRECYAGLLEQLGGVPVRVVALGTTGSGRQIAGLHAGTDAVINEIIAHATGAAHYDPVVDTIFEIGGQDAKYTFLTNGVPSDYAMNEACSAGTGSFLEEAAREALGIGHREIQEVALRGRTPPNFNDQCAAFISSDIKVAVHDGISREDITAGLVYSICMNYMNRVKGQRAVGKKVFMQGGVCYNRAVPLAMANLLGAPIVVPPDPGLMGAFGVALEVKHRIAEGMLTRGEFDLAQLAARDVQYGKSFACAGGAERCDRKCEIHTIIIGGRKHLFGGACNKYYNVVHRIACDPLEHDLVRRRQDLLFHTVGARPNRSVTGASARPRVGLNRSFLTHLLYPLYSRFLSGIGCEVVLPRDISESGVKRARTALCYPHEISHGMFCTLLAHKPDAVFLPKVLELHVDRPAEEVIAEHQCTCQLLQSEAYCLKSAFRDELRDVRVIEPLLNFSRGYGSQQDEFLRIAAVLGRGGRRPVAAYRRAARYQERFTQELLRQGRAALGRLQRGDPDTFAVVLFGRAYNAFAAEANFGIPAKFASRGITVIPWDMLPLDRQPTDRTMTWATGQNLLRAARFVREHPRLFGVYITNFSCGPDSFLLGYFRDIMGTKPSLTLELDSHTADAGVNTRIEAFIDVVAKHRRIGRGERRAAPFTPARVEFRAGRACFVAGDATATDMRDPSVRLLFPSMGRINSELMAAAFTGCGFHAEAMPVYDFEALRLGRSNASCKECLPLILVTGGLLRHLKRGRAPGEKLVYFMPTTSGSCRFSQYNVFLRKLIEKHRIENVALLTLTAENGYAGLRMGDLIHVLYGVVAADVLEDVRNALSVLARDREAAAAEFERCFADIRDAFARRAGVMYALRTAAARFAAIPLRRKPAEARTVLLLGEIFVRRDEFSLQDLLERLRQRDIVVRKAPVMEWLQYCDYGVSKGFMAARFNARERMEFRAKLLAQRFIERRVKRALAASGLVRYDPIDMRDLIARGRSFFDERFLGEPILIAGSFLREVPHHVDGAISIGPFGCMPSRVVEAVLSRDARERNLPLLTIETDGNAFPQILEARIEAFCLQVERLHDVRIRSGRR
jgi:predicted CoA-substrate-specific enzyme activase